MALQGSALGSTSSSAASTRNLSKPKPNWISVLDEDGNFVEDLDAQIKHWKWTNVQLGCHIVTAFGGKYTYDGKNKYVALDRIFGTDFGKSAWTAEGGVRLCPAKGANIIVMDIEGIGYYGDKEFICKAAILSFSLSDAVIFNFWGTDIRKI